MAIELVNGRPRSILTKEELTKEAFDSLEAMSPDEQAAFLYYLDELEKGNGGILDQFVKAEYLEEPVDPLTFLLDEYYLGQVGSHMWPKLQDDFVELFEGDYSEAILTGSLGWGKSFFATCGLAYILYQMSCLANPQEVYGLARGTALAIAILSATREAARRVPLAELGSKLQLSPYFKEKCPYKIAATMYEIRFPTKKMMVVAGSTSSAAIGTNVFSGFLDEMAFMGGKRQVDKTGRLVEVDKSEVLTKAIVRRMKSRFMRAGKLPGLMFLVSSKEKPVTFIEEKIAEASRGQSLDVFIRDYCLTGDTIIPLLEGTERRLDDLFAEFGGTDERFEVYSFDVSSGRMVSGRAFRPRLTARAEEILEVELDNGEVVRATPWHPFMLKDGTYRRADELQPGDSLMPLYRRLDDKGYEEVAQPWWGGRWQKTHHMAARAKFGSWPRRGSDGKPTVIHHEDFDKRNNTTVNLQVKVVAVGPGGRSDVYDLSVEGLENFAIGSGVFVHNSTWDVKPKENFSGKTFQIAVGNETVRSKIDPTTEDIAWYHDAQLRIIDVPEEYRPDFESDLEGALRDIAGFATESISLFIHRREKIVEAIDESLKSPLDVEEWMSGDPLEFWWERVAIPFRRSIPGGFFEEAWRPIRHPEAVRYVHIDTSLTGDCAGLVIAHIAGYTEVTRRDAGGESFTEIAPVIETDLMLRIIPPPSDEIFLGDIRGIVYEYQAHGFQIAYVSLDSYQSADTRQQFRQRGIESDVLSVDKTTIPYDDMKTALYENRIRLQDNVTIQRELRALQRVQKTKGVIPKFMVDHSAKGTKDVSDGLAGVVHSLVNRRPGSPIAPMVSERKSSHEVRDDSWVTGGKVMVPPSAGVRGIKQGIVGRQVSDKNMPMPFTRG